MIGYYHQTLLDYYGPTVLIKRFIPFDTDDKNEMFPSRRPVDECVDFIAECYAKAGGLRPKPRHLPTRPDCSFGPRLRL